MVKEVEAVEAPEVVVLPSRSESAVAGVVEAAEAKRRASDMLTPLRTGRSGHRRWAGGVAADGLVAITSLGRFVPYRRYSLRYSLRYSWMV